MDEICNRFEQFQGKRGKGVHEKDRRDFEEHLVRCQDCRDQWPSDNALLELFSKTEPPALPSRFNAELARRLSNEGAKISYRPLIMQVYWLAACLITAIILHKTLSINSHHGIWMMYMVLCFAAPTLLLAITLRLNVLDLILDTMHPPEKRINSFQNGQ
ncbi:MAG: hypothetical protein KJ645_02450 [Planctomycetes bacterium]|nr:hypothetical protein [Planctomycetota bacterium]